MMPLAGQPLLTAAGIRAAEDAAIAAGATVGSVMARAGQEIAAAVRRLAGANAILIVCGPGNNGGDGYVVARLLREAGLDVRIAALAEPKTDAAKAARAGWAGPIEPFVDAKPAPILIDALFGTGLTRGLDAIPAENGDTSPARHPGLEPGSRFLTEEAAGHRVKPGVTNNGAESSSGPVAPSPAKGGAQSDRTIDSATPIATKLRALADAAQLTIAIDLPSGVTTDDGRVLSAIPSYDVTLALAAAKPSHLLQPAARHCGAVRILDIGVPAASSVQVLARPTLPPPGPDAHKYSRGMVAIVAGSMPGAARLASSAAMRAGAGYVLLLGDDPAGPDALVHKPFSTEAIAETRINTLLIGPGLGRDAAAEARLDAALATAHPLVIDGDALHLLRGARLTQLAHRDAPIIFTPHGGEFDALFGASAAGKIERARAAAAQSGATIVFKGADTVIAEPDGAVRVAPAASPWLSTAGTGDVLAGAIAAMLAAGLAPLEAAAAGVWLHGEAARRCGAAFIADDLAQALSAARAAL
ncbi:NAD(P)H-hydrate dehydratase [Sphingomonas hylomeconis]|uniref:Bifunctional NAD(P)H-hydrate repair enzyme n=1 Tax=Sphingomonas hylomeconis TaxID=1395958 RepID=A0ABV7SYS5_9SPHN|nr:NAD(P)H-hydrate dehydratase [Sphingomonas hylomeconis]